MIKITCPKCKKVTEHIEVSVLNNDMAFWCCPDKKCRYISGHTKELPKVEEVKEDKTIKKQDRVGGLVKIDSKKLIS